jgi:hypothetical protein
MNQDENHLSLLSVFHYIMGGLTLLTSLVFVVYIVVGALVIAQPEGFNDTSSPNGPPPAFMGGLFIGIGVVAMVMVGAIGVLQIVAGASLRSKRRFVFCLVVAGLNCLNAPLGTILGVFTFLVLFRPTVKELFLGPPMSPGGPYRAGA